MLEKAIIGTILGMVLRATCRCSYIIRSIVMLVCFVFIGISAAYGSEYAVLASLEVVVGYCIMYVLSWVNNVLAKVISPIIKMLSAISSLIFVGAKHLEKAAENLETSSKSLVDIKQIKYQEKQAEINNQLKNLKE